MNTNSSDDDVNPFQHALLVEDWRTAVRDIGRLLGQGGMKKLALELWPAKRESAENWLSDCLNPNRSAKLDPDELLLILKIGHRLGYHGLMYHLCDEAAYSRPAPITPEDQRDEWVRVIAESSQALERAMKGLAKLGIKV